MIRTTVLSMIGVVYGILTGGLVTGYGTCSLYSVKLLCAIVSVVPVCVSYLISCANLHLCDE